MQALKKIEASRDTFSLAVKRCPQSVPLWRLAARLELDQNNTTKARSIIEKARLRNSRNPELWLEAVRIEREKGIRLLVAFCTANYNVD